jgi:hypothetical protein
LAGEGWEGSGRGERGTRECLGALVSGGGDSPKDLNPWAWMKRNWGRVVLFERSDG